MDDHFDTSSVFEISKFDISKFACIWHFGTALVYAKYTVLFGQKNSERQKLNSPQSLIAGHAPILYSKILKALNMFLKTGLIKVAS